MSKNISFADVLKLDIKKRIQFIEDVWDSIADMPEAVKITDEQKKELDRRLEEYYKNPDAGSPWKEVKRRILKSQ